MSEIKPTTKVKLICSIFSPEDRLIMEVIKDLEAYFGAIDWLSEKLIFDRTQYYKKEMGWPLFRRFVSFSGLIPPDHIVDVKLTTNQIERKFISGNNRKANIDPGYVSLERLVLATGKNYTHRIYLKSGIYADLTLVFHAGSFRFLDWTYPDYADEKVIGYFNTVREGYLQHLREEKKRLEREEYA